MSKKLFALVMAIVLCFSLAGCCCLTTAKKDKETTTTKPQTGATVIGGDEDLHIHTFVSTVTVEANCIRTGEMTYACDCGYSYTEEIPVSDQHNWEEATCETAQYCKDCDYIQTSALGHNYVNHYCTRCRQVDPVWANGVGKCSLYFGNNYPVTITVDDTWGDPMHTVTISKASYEFTESYWDDEVNLTVTVTGKKTYDYYEEYFGSDYSRSCYVYYVLYDSDGYAEKTGTFYTGSICSGESFETTLSFSYLEPGAYTLELLSESYY